MRTMVTRAAAAFAMAGLLLVPVPIAAAEGEGEGEGVVSLAEALESVEAASEEAAERASVRSEVLVDGCGAHFVLAGDNAAGRAAGLVDLSLAERRPLSVEELSSVVKVDASGVAQAFGADGRRVPLPEGLRSVSFGFESGQRAVEVSFPASKWSRLDRIVIDDRPSDTYLNVTDATVERIRAVLDSHASLTYGEFGILAEWFEADFGILVVQGEGVSLAGRVALPGVHTVDFGLGAVVVIVADPDEAGQGQQTVDPDAFGGNDADSNDPAQDGEGDSGSDSSDANVVPVPSGKDRGPSDSSAVLASGPQVAPAVAEASAGPQVASATQVASPVVAATVASRASEGIRPVEKVDKAQARIEPAKVADSAEAPKSEAPAPAPVVKEKLCLPSTCVKGGAQNLASPIRVDRRGVGPMGVVLAALGGLGLGTVIMKKKSMAAGAGLPVMNVDRVIMKNDADWRFPRR